MTDQLYHFTAPIHLPKIRAAGYLRPTESNVSKRRPHAGPKVVWLLDDPDPLGDHGVFDGSHILALNNERRVSRGLAPWSELPADMDKRAVRITVNAPNAVRWLDWPWRSQMTKAWERTFVAAGGGPDAVARWWLVEGRVPASQWGDVQVRGSVAHR